MGGKHFFFSLMGQRSGARARAGHVSLSDADVWGPTSFQESRPSRRPGMASVTRDVLNAIAEIGLLCAAGAALARMVRGAASEAHTCPRRPRHPLHRPFALFLTPPPLLLPIFSSLPSPKDGFYPFTPLPLAGGCI